MSGFTKWMNNFAVDYLLKYMVDNKQMVNEKINKSLNVPILSEKQESELIEIVQDVLIKVIKTMKK